MWHWSVHFNRIQIWFVYFLFNLFVLDNRICKIGLHFFLTCVICSGYPWRGGCCIKTHNFWYHEADMWCSSGKSWKRLGCRFFSASCEMFIITIWIFLFINALDYNFQTRIMGLYLFPRALWRVFLNYMLCFRFVLGVFTYITCLVWVLLYCHIPAHLSL